MSEVRLLNFLRQERGEKAGSRRNHKKLTDLLTLHRPVQPLHFLQTLPYLSQQRQPVTTFTRAENYLGLLLIHLLLLLLLRLLFLFLLESSIFLIHLSCPSKTSEECTCPSSVAKLPSDKSFACDSRNLSKVSSNPFGKLKPMWNCKQTPLKDSQRFDPSTQTRQQIFRQRIGYRVCSAVFVSLSSLQCGTTQLGSSCKKSGNQKAACTRCFGKHLRFLLFPSEGVKAI